MEFFDQSKAKLHGLLQNSVNAVKAIPTVSRFLEDGTLTPEEFVRAGDLLVAHCPSWSWQPGDPSKAVAYLPKEKQFLLTRNVPCHERVKTMEGKKLQATTVVEEGSADPWVLSTAVEKTEQEATEIKDLTSQSASLAVDDDDDDDGNIPDAETFDLNTDNIDHDKAALVMDDNVLKTRTYDLSITYDLYYQTPKVWLFGYDESHQPLKPQQVFSDISEDHAKKTVTIESHPHLSFPCAFIHPCKHSVVMKKIVGSMLENNKTPRVDLYLFLFLKFISAVIPTIEYDFTIEMDT